MALDDNRSYLFDGSTRSGPLPIKTGTPGRVWTSLSCAGASFCDAADRNGHVAAYRGTGWRAAARVAPDFTLAGLQRPLSGIAS